MNKRIVSVVCATLAFVAMGCTPALARWDHFRFDFVKGQKHDCYGYKDNTYSNWLVSIGDGSWEMYGSQNILGIRARKTNGTAASNYHTFSRKPQDYSLPYTSKPNQNTQVILRGQVDGKSTGNRVRIGGYWRP